MASETLIELLNMFDDLPPEQYLKIEQLARQLASEPADEDAMSEDLAISGANRKRQPMVAGMDRDIAFTTRETIPGFPGITVRHHRYGDR